MQVVWGGLGFESLSGKGKFEGGNGSLSGVLQKPETGRGGMMVGEIALVQHLEELLAYYDYYPYDLAPTTTTTTHPTTNPIITIPLQSLPRCSKAYHSESADEPTRYGKFQKPPQ